MNNEVPAWVRHSDDTDLHFIRRLVLASGSLKQLAHEYEVSYPTIRQRLDKIIERIRTLDTYPEDDALEARIRVLVTDRTLDVNVARQLLPVHALDDVRPHLPHARQRALSVVAEGRARRRRERQRQRDGADDLRTVRAGARRARQARDQGRSCKGALLLTRTLWLPAAWTPQPPPGAGKIFVGPPSLGRRADC